MHPEFFVFLWASLIISFLASKGRLKMQEKLKNAGCNTVKDSMEKVQGLKMHNMTTMDNCAGLDNAWPKLCQKRL